MSTGQSASGLVAFLVIVFAAAFAGSRIVKPALGGWYAALKRPSFTPPNWIFAPVWTTLYVLMAVAAWLVWKEEGFAAHKAALVLFLVQLFLNALWSPVFFGLHRIGAGFLIIVFLWLAILATSVAFWGVSASAGAMLVPYQLWVTYAAVLNYALWRMNS
jgi:tryptophan-rich sensory protein